MAGIKEKGKLLILLLVLFALSCQKQVEESAYEAEQIPTEWFDMEEFWSYAEDYTYTIFPENSDTIRIDMRWSPSNDTYGKRIEIIHFPFYVYG